MPLWPTFFFVIFFVFSAEGAFVVDPDWAENGSIMQVFNIASSSGRPFWILLPAFVILVVAIGLLVTVALARGSARFEVSSDGVRLRGDLWGRFIPMVSLRVDQARRVDFSASPELLPGRRTMGTGLPGYQSGWFRLKNGGKALLYLTDRSKAVYIPTTEGFAVLLSPDDPDGFMRALKDVGRP